MSSKTDLIRVLLGTIHMKALRIACELNSTEKRNLMKYNKRTFGFHALTRENSKIPAGNSVLCIDDIAKNLRKTILPTLGFQSTWFVLHSGPFRDFEEYNLHLSQRVFFVQLETGTLREIVYNTRIRVTKEICSLRQEIEV